jgi:hypothetical protein
MTATTSLTEADLRQFTGSECWHRHGLVRNILFTDGAKYLADEAGAYWLLDEIALAQKFHARVAAAAFQLWTLTVKPDQTATLACEDGNGKPVFAKGIAYTDFPLPEITLYYTDRTILLPSEY